MNTTKRIGTRASPQSGFSLLEVLISIVITSVGLLGLAGMQAAGIRNNHSAYHHSQATVLAYDMADRMRANTSAINNYQTSFMALAAAQVQEQCTSSDSETVCSAVNMAESDLFDWKTELAAAIPGSIGAITLTGGIYTVSVSWDDNRDGGIDENDPNFRVSFQP